MAFIERSKTILALVLSVGFVYAGLLNLQQRWSTPIYQDGVLWRQGQGALVAEEVRDSRFSNPQGARIEAGDRLVAIDGLPVGDLNEYDDVAAHLESLPPGETVRYRVRKGDGGPEVALSAPLRLEPRVKAIDHALAFAAIAILAIGCFIFLRNWRTPRAFHFFLVCLTAFVLLLYRFTGTADFLDQVIYWADALAFLLMGPLLLHFACTFPKQAPLVARMPRVKTLIYAPFGALAFAHALWYQGLLQPFGLPRTLESAELIDKVHLVHLAGFLGLAALALWRMQNREANPLQRQQLKWIAAGAFFGTLPVVALYTVPVLLGANPDGLLGFAVLSIVLIPLGFAYAITRYRLMDVDLIFKKGAAYAVTSSGLLVAYVLVVLGLGRLLESLYTSDSSFLVYGASALLLGVLFAPVKTRVQEAIDRRFYKDEYAYRESFSDFGKALGSETQLSELTHKICERVQDALSISPVAIFLRDDREPDLFHLYRSAGRFAEAREGGEVRLPGELLRSLEAIHIPQASGEDGSRGLSQMIFGDWGIEFVQPLRVRQRVIGFMGLGRREDGHAPSSEDLSLIATLSGYAAIAIDNAILYDSLESKAGQLSRLKAYSENVVESITVGVTVVSPEGEITVWNNAMQDFYGLARGQAVGRKVAQVFQPELCEALRNMLDGPDWSVDSTRQIYKTHVEDRQGDKHLTNITLTPFVARDGVDSGLLVLFEDITEKVQLENQLQQAEKLSSIGLFAAGVAHEVNTPLAGISSYTQMLLDNSDEDDPRYETLKKIEKQSFRASEIINNLLNFARMSDAEASELSLNNLMMEAVSLLEHQFKKGDVEVQLDLDPYLPRTMGVGGKLQQVFMNLFLNARDAMPKGGDLRIRTFRQGDHAIVEVGDTGSGISEEDLKRIYDPFFTTKEVGKGTGLGLSVSYGIIQEHSGQISVDSRPGEGTTFQVKLPINRVN